MREPNSAAPPSSAIDESMHALLVLHLQAVGPAIDLHAAWLLLGLI